MINTKPIDFCITVPGKVILHGEHSVVHGKTALAASVNLKTKLKFTSEVERNMPCLVLDFPGIEFNHDFPVKDLREIFKKHEIPLMNEASHRIFSLQSPDPIDFEKLLELTKEFLHSLNLTLSDVQENAILSFLCLFWGMFSSVDAPLPSGLIRITSELDIGAGMGSSTAYNICLAAAFLQFIRRSKVQQLSNPREISRGGYKSFRYWMTDLMKFEKDELELISRWGHFGDRIMHGNPSGIDNAVCTYGSVIQFKKGSHGPDIKIIPDPKFLKILLVNTKVPRNTKSLVQNVASLKDRLACVVDPILQAMDSVALTAAEVLRRMSQTSDHYDPPYSKALEETLSKEIKKLEELIDVNQKLLEALGVSHDTLEHICQIAKLEGLHGKLTGAGGGGYAFVILPFSGYDKQLCAVKMAYEKHHFPVQQVTLGGPGVTLMDNLSPNYELLKTSNSSITLSLDRLPSFEGGGTMALSAAEFNAQNLLPQEEENLDEWPWPFDLREVVKSMFDTHIKGDLEAGEIAIPLKSLCAVNIPEPLPQWMDKVTNLQDRIAPTWKNTMQDGQLRNRSTIESTTKSKQQSNRSTIESTTKSKQQSTVSALSTGPVVYDGPHVEIRETSHSRGSASKVADEATVLKSIKSGKGISIDLKPNELHPITRSKADTNYYIPKQASYREKLHGEMDHPTKWLKDQFPPHGKREWKYGTEFEEAASKQIKGLQRKHKKFLKQQRPGCDFFRNTYHKED